jgi:biopolymer transport protein ExbD
MKFKPRRSEEPEVNLISLIDVVLMLVVFFMLSSTFLEEGRLSIKLPQATRVPLDSARPQGIVVSVEREGRYRVNNRELLNASADTLRAALVKEAGDDRRRRIIVRADAQATHQSVVTALDVLGRLGFNQVSIATIKSETTAP